MFINDIGITDHEALALLRERLTTAQTEIAAAEKALRQHEAAFITGRGGAVHFLVRRKIKKLRARIEEIKETIELAERVESELVARINAGIGGSKHEESSRC